MTVVAEEPRTEELLELYQRMALIRATEKAASSSGKPNASALGHTETMSAVVAPGLTRAIASSM